MKNRQKIFLIASLVVAAVVVVCLLCGVDVETVIGAGSLLAAAPAVAVDGASAAQTQVGSVGTNAVDTEGAETGGSVASHPAHNKSTVSQKLSKVMASNYPLDTMLRNIASGNTKSDKYEFYSIVSRGFKAEVKTKVTVASTDDVPVVTLPLASGCHCLSKDGDLFVPSFNVVSKDSVVAVEEGAIALHPLVLNIVGINYGAKTIDVIGINAPLTALPSKEVPAGTILYRSASAKDQDAAMSEDPMATPTKDYNMVQRNLCTISENVFQALQEKEVQYGMAEFKEQALLDFRMQQEMASIFGPVSYIDEMVDPLSQKRKLHMKGLLGFDIQNIAKTDKDQDIENFFHEAMERMFSTNNGSERRLLLYGPGFGTKIATSKFWQKQLAAKDTEVVFGLKWNRIQSNAGELLALPHRSFGLIGPYTNAALIIDPANIRRIDQIKLQQTTLDLKKAGIRNSKDVTLDEAWTLEVTNPKTHGLLFAA